MRIVFLDIDDVLLTARAHALSANLDRIAEFARGHGAGKTLLEALPVTLDPVAVAMLNRLCRVAGTQIVVHSSWRQTMGMQETLDHLVAQGVETEILHPVAPCCPHACRIGTKAEEIRAWLQEASDRGESVERAVVLDDDVVFGAGDAPDGLLEIRVDDRVGLGVDDVLTAWAHFGVIDYLLWQEWRR